MEKVFEKTKLRNNCILPINTAIYILLRKHSFILSAYSIINSMKYLGENLGEKKISKTYTIKIITH